jgi:hypothetical protein
LPLTVALAVMMLIRHWNVATSYTLFCFGYERQLSLVGLADGIITIVGTVILVPRLGLIGAPIASITGAAIVGLPINLRAAAREMGVGVAGLIRPSVPLVAAIASTTALAVVTASWAGGDQLPRALGAIAGTLVVYAAAMTPFVVKGPLRPYAGTAWTMISVRRQASPRAAA